MSRPMPNEPIGDPTHIPPLTPGPNLMMDTHTTRAAPSHDSPTRRDLRGLARRRWPLIALAVAVLLVAFWALTRETVEETPGAAAAPGADGAASAAAATSDSIVTLDSTAQRLAGVELMTVAPSGSSTLVANGTITYDANRVSVVAPRVEGRIVTVRADLGQPVRAGAVLAVLQSRDVGETRGELARAAVARDVARQNYEREQRLFAEQISPQKELLDAEAAYRTAQADYEAAEAKLRAVGADGGGSGATYALTTPVTGTVVERNASPGQTVGPEASLFTVADLSHLWMTVDVYEGDLARVRQGATAVVVPAAYPNEEFTGRVTYAGGVIDSATRTFKVRVEVSNAERRLRPGMFAQVHIETPTTGGSGAITVPEVAVQELNGRQVVFVASDVPGQYVVRPVTIGPRAGEGRVVITEGLRAGERIVVQGAFQLKAELTKASFGEEE